MEALSRRSINFSVFCFHSSANFPDFFNRLLYVAFLLFFVVVVVCLFCWLFFFYCFYADWVWLLVSDLCSMLPYSTGINVILRPF